MKILRVLVLIFGLSVITSAQKTVLTGNVYADDGIVAEVKVTATSSDGNIFQARTNKDGVYQLEISAGIYSIEFYSEGFKVFKVENCKILPSAKKKMNFDIILEVRDCNDPLVDCHYVTGEPLKNEKQLNKSIKKKGK